MAQFTGEGKWLNNVGWFVFVGREGGPDVSPGITGVAQEKSYGLVVFFNDGTFATYPVEELLELRPHRESVEGQWPDLR